MAHHETGHHGDAIERWCRLAADAGDPDPPIALDRLAQPGSGLEVAEVL